jgi:hypothetical protein
MSNLPAKLTPNEAYTPIQEALSSLETHEERQPAILVRTMVEFAQLHVQGAGTVWDSESRELMVPPDTAPRIAHRFERSFSQLSPEQQAALSGGLEWLKGRIVTHIQDAGNSNTSPHEADAVALTADLARVLETAGVVDSFYTAAGGGLSYAHNALGSNAGMEAMKKAKLQDAMEHGDPQEIEEVKYSWITSPEAIESMERVATYLHTRMTRAKNDEARGIYQHRLEHIEGVVQEMGRLGFFASEEEILDYEEGERDDLPGFQGSEQVASLAVGGTETDKSFDADKYFFDTEDGLWHDIKVIEGFGHTIEGQIALQQLIGFSRIVQQIKRLGEVVAGMPHKRYQLFDHRYHEDEED